MDAQDRVELDRLMQRQSALQDELNRLNADLKLLADRFAVAPSEINPLEIAPLEIPPAVEPVQAAALPPHAQAVPPVIPTIPVAPPPPPPNDPTPDSAH